MATLDANGIYTEFTLGESYDDQMDSNLNRLSRFGFHLSVKSRALTAPPGGEVAGDAYIPAATASGAWLSKEGQIAFHTGTAWVFGIPRRGWRVLIENEGPSGVGLLVARTATGTWATVGADDSTATAAAIAAHAAASNPHPEYRPAYMAFASFPSASGNSGLVIGASDIGPAPGIELVSNGTRWRPRGGSQLLALRSDSPVTVQSLTEAIAETLSFVGGFVKAGDRLDLDLLDNAGAITTATRTVFARIGAAGSGTSGANFHSQAHINNAATSVTRGLGYLLIRGGSDITTVINSTGIYVAAITNGTAAATPNFANPWDITLTGQSAAENAETITSSSWLAGEVTFGYAATPSVKAVGDKIVVSGMTPSAYNGTYIVTSVPDTLSWKAALASDPGTSTVQGTSQRTSNVIIQGYKLTWSA